MASNNNNSSSAGTSKDIGAAEEPSPSSSCNATYDPAVFQPPHPDDRGAVRRSRPISAGRDDGDGDGVLFWAAPDVLRLEAACFCSSHEAQG